MDIICPHCGYESSTKGNLVRHLKSKKLCVATLSNNDREELIDQLMSKDRKGEAVLCTWCNKTVCKSHLARHKQKCKSKPSSSNAPATQQHTSCINTINPSQELVVEDNASTSTNMIQPSTLPSTSGAMSEIDIAALTERIKQEIMKELKGSSSVVNNNTFIITNANNINNTINVNNFGQEDTSYLTSEFLSYCLFNPKKGMSSLIENIHYNKDYPENHNIRCKSLKQNIFEKYVDAEWRACDASNTLDELIKKGYRILNSHYMEHYMNAPDIADDEYRQRALEKFRFLGDTTCHDYHAIKREVRLLVKDRTLYLLESPNNP
jgi:hypothetical protein